MPDYGGSENFTVQHVLNIMNDNVSSIEDVNTNGANSRLIPVPQTQENVNKTMRILVGSLEAMLAWNGKDGDGKQYQLQYEKFVPILVKALQEADDKIDALTARVAALES